MVIGIILISLLIISLLLSCGFHEEQTPEFFVGISTAYDNVEEIKQLVDNVSSYTNTIVIGSMGITHNFSKLDEVCQYIYDKGMRFIVYAHPINDPEELIIQCQWVLDAKPRWGENFVGLYAYDEPAGRQLDNATVKVVKDESWFADNYTDAADKFVDRLTLILNHTIEDQMCASHLPLFTSDYALYWFDYKAGYDVVFAEFGWNYSRHLNVALCRGAANIQNKEWGVMITWTYNEPPYIESGEELYDDLVLAYENGAKYVLVFDTNANYTHGILEDEHLDALKQFWQYTQDNPRVSNQNGDRVAYVLPKDYGYGFRGPDDKIWGLWEAHEDELSFEISTELGSLIGSYQNMLDIIYDDGLTANNSYGYSQLIFWNGTVLVP